MLYSPTTLFPQLKEKHRMEHEPLLRDNVDVRQNNPWRAALPTLAFIAIAGVGLGSQYRAAITKVPSAEFLRSNYAAFVVKTSNEYGDLNDRQSSTGAQDYPFLAGAYLMEPYKDNTVELSLLALKEGVTGVKWSLTKPNSNDAE
jgi:hypothetical protein